MIFEIIGLNDVMVACTGSGDESCRECRECGSLKDGKCSIGHGYAVQGKLQLRELVDKCEDCIVGYGREYLDRVEEDKFVLYRNSWTYTNEEPETEFNFCPICGHKNDI